MSAVRGARGGTSLVHGDEGSARRPLSGGSDRPGPGPRRDGGRARVRPACLTPRRPPQLRSSASSSITSMYSTSACSTLQATRRWSSAKQCRFCGERRQSSSGRRRGGLPQLSEVPTGGDRWEDSFATLGACARQSPCLRSSARQALAAGRAEPGRVRVVPCAAPAATTGSRKQVGAPSALSATAGAPRTVGVCAPTAFRLSHQVRPRASQRTSWLSVPKCSLWHDSVSCKAALQSRQRDVQAAVGRPAQHSSVGDADC